MSQDIKSKIQNFTNKYKYSKVQLSNTTFNYLLCGSGKNTLVLLDGGLGTSESWFEYVEFFKENYRVLTFSFPSNLHTNAEQVYAIHELLETLNIRNAIFVGVSYGGLLAQLFTKEFPDHTKGLVLISSGGMTEVTKEKLKKYKIPFKFSVFMAKILPFKLVRKNIIKESIKNMGGGQKDYRVVKEAMYALYSDMSKDVLINMGYLLCDIFESKICTSDDFKHLDDRSLLMLPQKDFFPKESQESLIGLMKNPKVIWLSDGSHGDPMFDRKYLKQIAKFLEDKFA